MLKIANGNTYLDKGNKIIPELKVKLNLYFYTLELFFD